MDQTRYSLEELWVLYQRFCEKSRGSANYSHRTELVVNFLAFLKDGTIV